MKNIVNIHCHVPPGVDDGANDTEHSLRMLQKMYDSGVRSVCFTSHGYPKYPKGRAEILESTYRGIAVVARDRFPDMELFLGQEIYFHSDCVKRLLSGECFTLNGTRTVLVEFDPMESLKFIKVGLSSFLTAGFVPVLAHVERYTDVKRNKNAVKELREMGVLLQVNADTVLGKYGFFPKQYVLSLIKKGSVDVVADDCHKTSSAGSLGQAYDVVLKKFGEQVAERLFCSNPAALLQG